MSNNNKVKGLLKALRFISQIFENDKDSEIQIGHPTDVKHVAHIGWDGQGQGQGHGHSENKPSWMNEFQSVPGNSSAPVKHNRDTHSKGSHNSVQMASEGEEESHELNKSSKRQSNTMGNIRESHAKEKSDRPRESRKPSKHSHTNDLCNDHQSMHSDDDSLESDLPRKRSRPKISKDGSKDGSKSRQKSHHHHHLHHHHSKDSNSNQDTHSRSSSKSRNKRRSFDDDGQFARGPSENILQSYPN